MMVLPNVFFYKKTNFCPSLNFRNTMLEIRPRFSKYFSLVLSLYQTTYIIEPKYNLNNSTFSSFNEEDGTTTNNEDRKEI